MARLLLDHFGLASPRRPERILALAVAAVLGAVALAAAFHFWRRNGLMPGTPRLLYFAWVGGLVLVGLLAAPRPRIAMVVLSLATVELGLGLGSRLMERFDLASGSLLPANWWADSRFAWHPLLQAVPVPTRPGEVTTLRHNSQRQRGPERSASGLADKRVVATFGGSTTYDQENVDGETWPEQLERLLGPARHAVINHGMGGYSSAEHLLQTVFYEKSFGRAPDCAVYYMGWNDIRSAHVPGLDPGYADLQLPGQIDAEEVRRIGGQGYSISPTLWYLVRLVVLAVDTARPPSWTLGPFRSHPDPVLEEIYARNVEAISAVNRQRGIRTIWVGQVLNRDRLGRVPPSPWVPYVHPRDLWALVERLNGVLARRGEALGDAYVDVPVAAFGPDDFVDEGHFNARGALKFATLLAPGVARACP